jgi:hypothetical protein
VVVDEEVLVDETKVVDVETTVEDVVVVVVAGHPDPQDPPATTMSAWEFPLALLPSAITSATD